MKPVAILIASLALVGAVLWLATNELTARSRGESAPASARSEAQFKHPRL